VGLLSQNFLLKFVLGFCCRTFLLHAQPTRIKPIHYQISIFIQPVRLFLVLYPSYGINLLHGAESFLRSQPALS
jgi:hypothetical protein